MASDPTQTTSEASDDICITDGERYRWLKANANVLGIPPNSALFLDDFIDAEIKTHTPYKWPTPEEMEQIHPGGAPAREAVEDLVRQVRAALAAGADYVSLRDGTREIGRIYPDGRHWNPV